MKGTHLFVVQAGSNVAGKVAIIHAPFQQRPCYGGILEPYTFSQIASNALIQVAERHLHEMIRFWNIIE
jgi:hypothetical protein